VRHHNGYGDTTMEPRAGGPSRGLGIVLIEGGAGLDGLLLERPADAVLAPARSRRLTVCRAERGPLRVVVGVSLDEETAQPPNGCPDHRFGKPI